jgi:predicted phosphodiesterase
MIRNKKIKDVELVLDRGSIFVASDIHFPFQDDNAVDCFVRECEQESPDVIVLNGDLMDFYKLSRFSKDPKGRDPEEEIDMCRDFLSTLRNAVPDAKIYYTIGNHETRLTKYVLDNAPYISGLIENVFDLLKIDEFGVVGCSSLLLNDKFIFKHGTRLGNKSGLSAIKELEAHYLSGASGHTHRLAKYTTRKSGKRFVWFETGCLCTLDPEYMSQPDWQQGFAKIFIENKKVKSSYIVEIENGEIV